MELPKVWEMEWTMIIMNHYKEYTENVQITREKNLQSLIPTAGLISVHSGSNIKLL